MEDLGSAAWGHLSLMNDNSWTFMLPCGLESNFQPDLNRRTQSAFPPAGLTARGEVHLPGSWTDRRTSGKTAAWGAVALPASLAGVLPGLPLMLSDYCV